MNQGRLRVLLLMTADAATLAGTLAAAAGLCRISGGSFSVDSCLKLYPLIGVFIVSGAFLRLYHGNIFYPGAALGPIEEMRRGAFAAVIAYLAMFAFARSEGCPAGVLATGCAGAVLLLPVGRWIVRTLMKKLRFGQIRALVAGAGNGGATTAAEFRRDRHFGIEVVGFLDDRKTESPDGVPIVGRLSDAEAAAKKFGVSYIICCLPLPVTMSYLSRYAACFRHVTIIPDVQIFPVAWAYPLNFHGRGGIEIRNQLLLAMPRVWKAVLEAVLSALVLVAALPLIGLLAIGVKLTSRGKIFYRARRIGRNGSEFRLYKFRTMYRDADMRLRKILSDDNDLAEEWRSNFKLRRDPRITPFGSFLRRTSLDELPQLLNVLRGEMALIGPRPIVEAEIEKYGENYAMLKRVKPGITGLWQVSGRSDLDYEKRVRLDMNYIMNWTVWLDYYILLKTVKEVIMCSGAR